MRYKEPHTLLLSDIKWCPSTVACVGTRMTERGGSNNTHKRRPAANPVADVMTAHLSRDMVALHNIEKLFLLVPRAPPLFRSFGGMGLAAEPSHGSGPIVNDHPRIAPGKLTALHMPLVEARILWKGEGRHGGC